MTTISSPNAPEAIGPYSQAVISGGLIYTSGQIALRADGSFYEGDIKSQTRQVLENLKSVLEAAGSSFSKVIKTTVFLSDMKHFDELNEIYGEYFSKYKPARSTVAVKSLPRNALVEIECVAKQ